MLKRAIAAARERGLEMSVGHELEFYLLRRTPEGGVTLYQPHPATVYRLDRRVDPEGGRTRARGRPTSQTLSPCGLSDCALQDPPRVGSRGSPSKKQSPMQIAVSRSHGSDPKRREVGTDLHVPETELVPQPGPIGHDPGVVDGEDGDAEVEAVLPSSSSSSIGMTFARVVPCSRSSGPERA